MITNDEAVNSVYEAIDIIEQLPISESNLNAVQRLKGLIQWLEVLNEQIAEWESETNESFVPPLNKEEV